jgi:hypothetical protein
MFSTPLLFIVFNRPQLTRTVFERIRELQPQKLYIAADGPRSDRDDDCAKCTEVRSVFAEIDWPCQVTTRFLESNLGCKRAVSDAIAWFFAQEQEGIILEDDILPDPSFFPYCREMLSRYRTDSRVMHVAGFNVCGRWRDPEQSYHFCRFGSIWGWASWRRAWRHYDVEIKAWADSRVQERLLNTFFPADLRPKRKALYDELYAGRIDTWDYQWTLCRLLQDGLAIAPARNLVRNLGFGVDATHTRNMPGWVMNESHGLVPPFVTRDTTVDRTYDHLHLLLSTNNVSYATFQGAGRKGRPAAAER